MTLREAQTQIGWLESCGRSVSGEGNKGNTSIGLKYLYLTCQGYGPLIRAYVQFLLEKLSFHRIHTEFNGTSLSCLRIGLFNIGGTFEYEEYISLKNINDPNEGYRPYQFETTSDLLIDMKRYPI